MAYDPEQHFQNSFESDAKNVYQWLTSKLTKCVRTERQTVEQHFFNYIDALDDDMTETATRLGDTVWTTIDHLRRRTTLVDKDKAIPIADPEVMRMGYDPTNPYTVAMKGYFSRWVDRKILTRALGVAYTGKAGATSVNIYDVGECRVMESDGTLATAGSDLSNKTATVLTPEKLQILGALFDDAGVPDDGQRYVAVDSYQVRQMAMDANWTYEQRRVLNEIQNGKMEQLCGFQLPVLPQSYFSLNATDTEAFETIAWHRDAIVAVAGDGDFAPKVRIAERADKKHVKQIFMQMHMDATRLLGKGVVKVGLKQVTTIS